MIFYVILQIFLGNAILFVILFKLLFLLEISLSFNCYFESIFQVHQFSTFIKVTLLRLHLLRKLLILAHRLSFFFLLTIFISFLALFIIALFFIVFLILFKLLLFLIPFFSLQHQQVFQIQQLIKLSFFLFLDHLRKLLQQQRLFYLSYIFFQNF